MLRTPLQLLMSCGYGYSVLWIPNSLKAKTTTPGKTLHPVITQNLNLKLIQQNSIFAEVKINKNTKIKMKIISPNQKATED